MPETMKPAPLYSQCLKAFVELQVAQDLLDAGEPRKTMETLQGVRSTLEEVLLSLAGSGPVGRN